MVRIISLVPRPHHFIGFADLIIIPHTGTKLLVTIQIMIAMPVNVTHFLPLKVACLTLCSFLRVAYLEPLAIR